jgi:hypothetical protein
LLENFCFGLHISLTNFQVDIIAKRESVLQFYSFGGSLASKHGSHTSNAFRKSSSPTSTGPVIFPNSLHKSEPCPSPRYTTPYNSSPGGGKPHFGTTVVLGRSKALGLISVVDCILIVLQGSIPPFVNITLLGFVSQLPYFKSVSTLGKGGA